MEQDCYPSFNGCFVNNPCLFTQEKNAYFVRKRDSRLLVYLRYYLQWYERNDLLLVESFAFLSNNGTVRVDIFFPLSDVIAGNTL